MHVIGASLQMCWFTELKIIVNLSQSVTKKKGKQPFTTDTLLNSSFKESSYQRRFKVKNRETPDGINFFLCL